MTPIADSTEPAEPQVIKQDTKGRVRTPPERREALLDEFERSGMSAMRFANHVGVKYATFAAWVAKRRRRRESESAEPGREQGPEAPVRWLDACLPAGDPGMESDSTRLVVELPGGIRLGVGSFQQAAWAAEMIRQVKAGGRDKPC